MYARPLAMVASPQAAARALAAEPGLAWLDGGLEHGREGRWSFVSARPTRWVARGFGDRDPLAAVDELLGCDAPDAHALGLRAEDVPRWIGYLAYDAYWSARGDGRLERPEDLPVLCFARYDAVLAFDHERQQQWVVGDDEATCRDLEARLTDCAARHCEVGEPEATEGDQHRAAIRVALDHIREGNIYQVNLARRFRARLRGQPLSLWEHMRTQSPVPLGMYFEPGDHAVLACTMERFVRWRRSDDRLWTSPIKGTLGRSGDDIDTARALRSDPKEQAEHRMIVDLMRNDLGRIAQVGSVEVASLMEVLPFAGLSHLVSTVEATAKAGLSLRELWQATTPPGSVTGTPKRRAMEIIEELEQVPRGPYTGALGFVDRAGGCSLAVAIRTAVAHGGWIDYHAGGGVVADSDPDRETAETDLKARVFLDAVRASKS